jgi:hypothetical protein
MILDNSHWILDNHLNYLNPSRSLPKYLPSEVSSIFECFQKSTPLAPICKSRPLLKLQVIRKKRGALTFERNIN